MRPTTILTALLSTLSVTSAFHIPSNIKSLGTRWSPPAPEDAPFDLEKRRGGGGGGRSSGGGGGTTSGSGGTTSSGGSGRTSGSGSGGTTSSGGTGGTRGTTGGTGTTGTRAPTYGGVYQGGSRSPYRSGAVAGGLVPGLLIGGALSYWALSGSYGWPYGAYQYSYPSDVTYTNQTTGMQMTVKGICLCSRYEGCSCSGTTPNGTVVDGIIGDGSYAHQQQNAGLYQLTTVNGTQTLAINGTLDNGTTSDAGTTTTTTSTSAAAGRGGMGQKAGWVALAAIVGSAVWVL